MEKKVKAGKKAAEEALVQIDFVRLTSLFGLIVVFLAVFYHLLFWGRVYPGVLVARIDVGGKKPEQVEEILKKSLAPPDSISLVGPEQKYTLLAQDLAASYNFASSAQNAYSFARSGNPFSDFSSKWEALSGLINLPLVFSADEQFLTSQIEEIATSIDSPPIEPQVTIQEGEVKVFEGQSGRTTQKDLLVKAIMQRIGYADPTPIEIPQKFENPELSDEEAEELKKRVENFLGKSLILILEEESFTYKDDELISLLDPKDGFSEEKVNQLVDSLALGINQPPQNATFVFEADRVREFEPAKDGREVKEQELAQKILEVLVFIETRQEKSVEVGIPAKITPPKVTIEEVNDLGIKELIGKGSSRFRGSISGRVHNIALSASRINGILIAPGEVFSFNNALGDVSIYTGYQQSYIIKDGRTILGDGGGVCQVSTTFFRAALDAGLPILERRQHSYRVSYYEQDSPAGFDATVYSPSVDLKVKNDTPAHILIQAKADTKNMSLVFEFYGAGDGRVVEISDPRVWDVVPPPPPLYQDDPTLPAGTTKQVDFAAWGAKAAFDYLVVRNGEVLQDRTFYSAFRPWQAVYLQGTAR